MLFHEAHISKAPERRDRVVEHIEYVNNSRVKPTVSSSNSHSFDSRFGTAENSVPTSAHVVVDGL